MRTVGFQIVLLVVLFVVPTWAQDETIDWLDNYQKAIEEAKRTNKPIFLEFRCEA